MKHCLLTKLLFTFFAAWISLSASAADYDFKVDGFYYKLLSASDLTCEVVAGDEKYKGDVVIPSTVVYKERTLTVTLIGYEAFKGCTSLTSVNIPNSVTSIGYYAFYDCTSLTSVTIPNSVTSIGYYAFYDCTSLSSVIIPNSITWIEKSAFEHCTSLTSVNIPISVTEIGEKAFYGCTSLASVNLPNSITDIADGAFKECTGLTSVIIPNSVTSIGGNAFSGCTSLTSVKLSNSVKEIGKYDYEKQYYPAFVNCDSLKSIEIGNKYGLQSFLRSNNYFSTLIIADDYADSELPSYYSYEVGDYVSGKEYKDVWLRDNSKLSRIISKTTKPLRWNSSIGFSHEQYVNLNVIVPTASLADYQAADVWKDFWELKGGAEKYTAGITSVKNNSVRTDNCIYNLQGVRLSAPQKGINIINGKKVLVK